MDKWGIDNLHYIQENIFCKPNVPNNYGKFATYKLFYFKKSLKLKFQQILLQPHIWK